MPAGGLAYLPMRDGFALVDFVCKYGTCSLEKGTASVAVVEAVAHPKRGQTVCVIRVASDDGGFRVLAEIARPEMGVVRPGDPVLWVPGAYSDAVAKGMSDARGGWVGFIVARLVTHMPVTPGYSYKIAEYLS